MPKIVNHDERKREIVNSALNLFSRQGYHSASFGDIASASGLSRTNVYNYFKNKDEIFHYAVEELLDTLSMSIESIIRQQDLSLAQKLQKIYQVFTNEFGEGKYTSIILDLALRLKREHPRRAAWRRAAPRRAGASSRTSRRPGRASAWPRCPRAA